MDIAQIRDELSQNIQKIDPIGNTLKFVLDEDIVLIDGTGSSNAMSEEDRDADCTIRMSKETYGKLQRKEIKPMMATLTGKIKVKGNIAVAQKLKQLM